MSTARQPGGAGSGQGSSSVGYPGTSSSTAWAGGVIFAATMMILVGGFTFIDGLVSLFNSAYYGGAHPLLLGNYQSWGWWNLVSGTLLVAAGFSLFTGATWARVVGIIFAVLNALSQLVLISVFPFWALVVITLDVVVIYALLVNEEVA
jgi:hypothetical protein